MPQLVTALSDRRVVEVVSGYNHGFCRCDDGTWFGFGANQYGQLSVRHGDEFAGRFPARCARA